MDVQDALVAARIEEQIPDIVLCLEHAPVITLGNRGRANHLTVSPDELAHRSITLARSTRGGDVTYHGPGQLILYPIIHLGASEADAHGYLNNLEEIAIRTIKDYGVLAFRRPGMTGAWTANGKLAAIGIRLKKWVTSHGMSLNVCPDLTGFNNIVPCGLVGEAVSSLLQILGAGRCPSVGDVRERMTTHFSAVCRRTVDVHQAPWAKLPATLTSILAPLLNL